MTAPVDRAVPVPPLKVQRELARRPLTLGEQRTLWREGHLCLACAHHHVCGMSRALDPTYLVVIAHCLAFQRRAPLGEPPPDEDSDREDRNPATPAVVRSEVPR